MSLGPLSSGKAWMNTDSDGSYPAVSWKYLTKTLWNLDCIKKGFNVWISQDVRLLVHRFWGKFYIMFNTFYKKSEVEIIH